VQGLRARSVGGGVSGEGLGTTGFDKLERDIVDLEREEAKPVTSASTSSGHRPARPPFLRGDDSGGFGPNASANRDDFDIPTVLRRQMD